MRPAGRPRAPWRASGKGLQDVLACRVVRFCRRLRSGPCRLPVAAARTARLGRKKRHKVDVRHAPWARHPLSLAHGTAHAVERRRPYGAAEQGRAAPARVCDAPWPLRRTHGHGRLWHDVEQCGPPGRARPPAASKGRRSCWRSHRRGTAWRRRAAGGGRRIHARYPLPSAAIMQAKGRALVAPPHAGRPALGMPAALPPHPRHGSPTAMRPTGVAQLLPHCAIAYAPRGRAAGRMALPAALLHSWRSSRMRDKGGCKDSGRQCRNHDNDERAHNRPVADANVAPFGIVYEAAVNNRRHGLDKIGDVRDEKRPDYDARDNGGRNAFARASVTA